MERKASDSKRRFVSYSEQRIADLEAGADDIVFHEVRVPLNTALLAVQNLEGENVFRQVQAEQGEMVHGLVRSLTTMEKVLNDVLSFNRMEAGKFTQARKPFDFHKSINLVALSHRPQAQSSGIELIIDLDGDIDKVGGVFIGDEMRLRQITSNLVSNSIKFTEQGSVKIVTKLIYPRLDLTSSNEDLEGPLRQATENAHQQAEEAKEAGRTSSDEKRSTQGTMLDAAPGRRSLDVEKGSIHLESLRHQNDPKEVLAPPMERGPQRDGSKMRQKAIVRVEIHDTGIGLKKDDLDE
jgi:signal transduction histidine kinase